VNRGGDVDTYDRYVYIHGTNHEDRIGEPLSAGCVLMHNLDIIELYDEVRGRSGDHGLMLILGARTPSSAISTDADGVRAPSILSSSPSRPGRRRRH
jgi:hypothetical protein